MHSFQPYPIYMLDWNPFDKFGRDSVAIVTKAEEKQNAISTKNGFVGTMFGKNVLGVLVRDSQYTKEILDMSENFSACFFDLNEKGNKMTLQIMNAISGRDENKLSELKLTVAESIKTPYLDEANFVILCKKAAAIPVTPETIISDDMAEKFYIKGDNESNYTLYIGEIKDILVR